ncbi:hypothetical protein EDD86DRAFT_234339, partial [Gorgonomyces haynaldii]
MFALLQTAYAWSTIGCYTPPAGTAVSLSQPFNAVDCVNACANRNAIYAAIQVSVCYCYNTTQNWVKQNDAECSQNCQDGFPCGGPFGRFTGYVIEQDTGVPPIVSASNTPTATPQITESTIGKGQSIDQWKIAAIAGGSIGALLILGVAFYLWRRNQKRSRNATLPRLLSSGRQVDGPLIPNLPRTPDMIYSVVHPYTSKRQDELDLAPMQVVAVRKVFKDGWAQGMNVTAGRSGVFPLACFLSEKDQIGVPARVDSL